MLTDKDYSETGMRLEGSYENDRNAQSSDLFKSIIREAYNVTDVIIAHHLVYVKAETHKDGFDYQLVQEVPSADALIFDHDVARKIWGENFLETLRQLACEPVATRDQLLAKLYHARKQVTH